MTFTSHFPIIVSIIAAGWLVLLACEPDVMMPKFVRQRVVRFSKRRGSRR